MKKMSILLAASLGVAGFASAPSQAAMLTFGVAAEGAKFGGYGCADVAGASIAPGTAVWAWDCHGAGNQQFSFNGSSIQAMALTRCLQASGTSVGATVAIQACNASAGQLWHYNGGKIVNQTSSLCLDAGAGTKGTALTLQTCAAKQSQTWQIK